MAESTELVELPAIVLGGQISIADPTMRAMSKSSLRLLANTMEGQLIWVKRRVVYEELETPLCTHQDCWRPAKDALECGDH